MGKKPVKQTPNPNKANEKTAKVCSLITNKTNINRNQLTLIHNWQPTDKFSIEQTVRNANYIREYKVNNNDGSLSTNDATEEKNTEYELLFNKINKNFTYNGGLEYSNPE